MKLRTFLQSYKLLSLTLLAAALSLGMELGKQVVTADWLLGITSAAAATALGWEMLQDLRHGRYSLNLLGLISIVAALIMGEYWAATAVVLIIAGGHGLENWARWRVMSELRDLIARAPESAEVVRKGKPVTVPASELHPGDKIVVAAAAAVPADAVVLDGAANFDETALTGDNLPQPKKAGDNLLSGSINLDGPVTAKVTATAAASHYQQLSRLVRAAAASRAPFSRMAERYSLSFSLAVLALAAAAWALTGESSRFLAVTIVATPLPFLAAVPLALLAATTRATKYGIVVKTGTALEALADSQSLAFEKTGTLTRGEPSVNKIRAYGKFKKDEVLRLAASLEQSSGEPAAAAVVTDARLKQIKLLKAKHVQEQAGLGLSAKLKGDSVLVGRLELLQNAGVKMPAKFSASQITDSAIFVAVNGNLAGYITLSDDLRAEAPAAFGRLGQLGITNTALLTGDNSASAQAAAKSVGADEVHSGLLASGKLQALGRLKPQPVAFVGDGLQGAPLLTAADVGIVFGASRSAAAAESGDVVIMLDNLIRVAASFDLARQAFAVARQALAIGVLLTLALMGVMATGKFTPLLGAGLQALIVVITLSYALRAHNLRPSNVH